MQVLLTFAGHISEEGKSENTNIVSSKRAVRRINSFNDLPKRAEEDNIGIIGGLCDAVADKKVCIVTIGH